MQMGKGDFRSITVHILICNHLPGCNEIVDHRLAQNVSCLSRREMISYGLGQWKTEMWCITILDEIIHG